LIWIFVRRDCDAGKIGAQCCKHLTAGTWENGVVCAIFTTKQGESVGVVEKDGALDFVALNGC
jgi:hypothetical protein